MVANLEHFCESIFPLREKVMVHLTINRERKQEEFVEEIRQFLEDLQEGLKSFLA